MVTLQTRGEPHHITQCMLSKKRDLEQAPAAFNQWLFWSDLLRRCRLVIDLSPTLCVLCFQSLTPATSASTTPAILIWFSSLFFLFYRSFYQLIRSFLSTFIIFNFKTFMFSQKKIQDISFSHSRQRGITFNTVSVNMTPPFWGYFLLHPWHHVNIGQYCPQG